MGTKMKLPIANCKLIGSRETTSRTAVRIVDSRLGITLIEILISLFVLLFGLMGVAAIFPVASHYVVEGEKRDRGGGLAQIAFEEIKARKLLRPTEWMYCDNPDVDTFNTWFLNAGKNPFPDLTRNGWFVALGNTDPGPGHVFVIDPLGGASITNQNASTRTNFPLAASGAGDQFPNLRFGDNPAATVHLTSWPIRRISLPKQNGNTAMAAMIPFVAMDSSTADQAFRLRDDLVVDQPNAGDRPSIQRWRTVDVNPTTGNQNLTPNDFSDDTLLGREYVGDYTWLATVVPTRWNSLWGLQPAANIRDEFYEVSAVVFYKRDTVPSETIPGSPGSERLIAGEFLNSGELALYNDNSAGLVDTVDTALDGIKPGTWIAVTGQHPVDPRVSLLRWYKILSLDDSNSTMIAPGPAGGQQGRYMMVQGADWPANAYTNLRVIILPGAIDVYTRVMQLNGE